ncbi:MAG: ATP-binding cassette domain-containing protein [Candidatus Odinarchaeia archaeon]
MVNNLSKYFGSFRAVDNISFKVRKGELFGILGPNGAGKTTTIRMLCTLLKPSSGNALIEGYDIVKKPAEVRRMLGVVSEGISLYDDLTAEENLYFLGRLYRLRVDYLKYKIPELLESMGLQKWANVLVRNFSTGMRKKLLILAALIHEPKVLLLDEVTSGLDPQTMMSIREKAINLAKDGITIIWTTHYIEEPEKICDRVAIISSGRVLTVDSPSEIKNKVMLKQVFEISCGEYIPLEVFNKIKLIEGIQVETGVGSFKVYSDREFNPLPEILRLLSDFGIGVRDVRRIVPSLEEAFIKLVEEAGFE